MQAEANAKAAEDPTRSMVPEATDLEQSEPPVVEDVPLEQDARERAIAHARTIAKSFFMIVSSINV